nr:hypothetical protein [Tanacetum cinerariifolium]
MDEQLEHIPYEALRIEDCTHCGSQMIDNHSMDRLVKDVLRMELVMHTEEDDTVLHIEKTGILMLVVEIDVGGMTADVVDKLNYSSDDVQPRQVDMRSAHALTELHWHDTHVNPDRHEVDWKRILKKWTKTRQKTTKPNIKWKRSGKTKSIEAENQKSKPVVNKSQL